MQFKSTPLFRLCTIAALANIVSSAPITKPLRTFGTGASAFSNAGPERLIFNHTLGAGQSTAAMTHFWTTGDTDDAVWSYYVDGEVTPSVQFRAPQATGTFYGDEALWANSKIGKGGTRSGYFVNIKVPFGRSIRITVTGAIKNGFVIVRGCENLPIEVGALTLPAAARLVLQKIERRTFDSLDFVPIVDLPQGDGLVYMTAIAASSTSPNFWEGCYHLHTPYAQPFPGTVLSTGMEDFFDSSYGFSGGAFHQPVSGCTHKDGAGGGMALSAYRFHEEDPIAFSGGVKFRWRVGDIINAETHPESPKCFIETLNATAGDKYVGVRAPANISTYAWIYTW
eukprot:g2659.t1